MADAGPRLGLAALALLAVLALYLTVEVGRRALNRGHRADGHLSAAGAPCSECRGCAEGLTCLEMWPAGLQDSDLVDVDAEGGKKPPGCCAWGHQRHAHCRAHPWTLGAGKPCHPGAVPEACGEELECSADDEGVARCRAPEAP